MALKTGLPDGVYERDQSENSYHKVLIVGGRGAQSAEINEIQQIQDSQRDRLTSSLYPEGTIISGGFASQDSESNIINVRETRIHLREYIFILPATQITPNDTESSTIGVLLTENFVGPDNTYGMKNGIVQVLVDSNNNPIGGDSSLLNPVEGTANFGTKGAMRVQYLVSWTAEPNPDSLAENQYYYPLYTTTEGKVIVTQSKTSSEIYDTIARYDNDSNGSYVISGMNVYYTTDNGNYHVCSVSEGVAHVNGYEVVYSYANPINIEKALDTYSRISEPITITASGSGEYLTRHSPIADVSRVLVTKQRTKIPFTHGVSGGRDSLVTTIDNRTVLNSIDAEANADNVLAVTKIVKVTYIKNGVETDCTANLDYVVDGDVIDWYPNTDNEPGANNTYYITLQYLTTNVEYSINASKTGIIINDDYVAPGEWCAIDYTHYLQRIDSIVLHSDGSLSIIKGAPAESNPIPQSTAGGLVLSTALIRYGYNPFFYNDFYKTVTKSEILEMKNAISTLQANLAQLDLKTDITVRDNPSTKAGMFVDPFFDEDQRDQGLPQTAEIIDQVLYPKRNWKIYTVHSGSDILLPSTNVSYVTQKYRTKSRFINEFVTMSGESPIGNISVTPSTYRWTADFTQVSNSVWRVYGTHRYGSVQGRSTSTQLTDTEAVFDVPVFSVTVNGSNFNGNEVVKIFIDGIEVGSTSTNSTGLFTTTVNTPSGMKSGIKQVTSVGQTSTCRAIASLSTIPQTSTRYVTTYYESDPIGQTFLNEEQCFASSVSVYFSAIPNDYVTLCLTETSSGYPDPTKIIARKTLQKNQITTSGFTKFTFDSPVILNPSSYYSFILISSENVGQVYVAELGKRDNWNSAWMTQNVFASGTMVQASQLYTWSAIQTEDLTFMIERCKFENTKKDIVIGTVQIPSDDPVTQLYLLSDSEVFSNTSMEYKAVLSGDAGSYSISEYTPLTLNTKYSGELSLVATLSSDSPNGMLSPRILGDVQIAGCVPQYPSNYISRAFQTNGTSLKIYLDVYESGRWINMQYQDASTGIWYDLDTYNGDTDMKYPPENLGDGWSTRVFYKEDIGTIGSTKGYIRVKIIFDSPSSSINTTRIPACKNLRVLTA